MAGKIRINTERCKGCGLCVLVCPKKNIVISKKLNKSGYFPAETKNPPTAECTGCAACAIICPDVAIEVFCESKVETVKSNSSWRSAKLKPDKKRKPNLIKEKA